MCRWLVVAVVRALSPWETPLEPAALLPRWLFVLDVMAQPSRLMQPRRSPPPGCDLYTAPSPSGAVRLPITALGRGQRLRIMGCGPLALGSTQLAETRQCVRVCPEGPAA